MNYKTATILELLNSYDSILEELRHRGITRNSNPPAGGYAEYLAAEALDLTLANNSNTGYDATDLKGARYEIKGRRATRHNKSRQLSAIRNIENCHFDYLIGVIFTHDFQVLKAALVPHSLIVEKSRFSNHTNSSILILADNIWDCEGVRDITEALREVQNK